MTLALAGPVCLATAAAVLFAVTEMGGHTLSSEGPVRNLAEAAALGSASEVVALLGAGADPIAVVDVRSFAISSSVTRASALEAAVWSRSAPLFGLFTPAVAGLDAPARRHLICLAQDLRADEILTALAPREDESTCEPGQTLATVMARSGHTP
jgi:hypothetical protein